MTIRCYRNKPGLYNPIQADAGASRRKLRSSADGPMAYRKSQCARASHSELDAVLGWNPASNSEAGGMYFRREGRILERGAQGGGCL